MKSLTCWYSATLAGASPDREVAAAVTVEEGASECSLTFMS
jgi:hypothetical protein